MAKRILRLAFAMGGGVSLGTFNGAALSELLKLVLLERSNGAWKWDKVEVDVFSGASAGALSLLVMLRSLVSPKDYGYTRWKDAEKSLSEWLRGRGENPAQLKAGDDARWQDLVAAQLVQDAQKRTWVEEVEIKGLLPRDAASRLRYRASLLDRGFEEEIARRMLAIPPGGVFTGFAPRLLAERVLYACSLSGLIPTIEDARTQTGVAPPSLAGLGDGMRTFRHRELRVFDLCFGKHEFRSSSSRWVRMHSAPEEEGNAGDLRLAKSWSRIGATAIACGAFPFALDPVVLTRSRYEFPSTEWDRMLAGVMKQDGKKADLPYVDGGMFNNEPIREAFRLSAFRDSTAPPAGDDTLERLLFFVDPFVSEEKPVTSLEVFRRFSVERPLALGDLEGVGFRRKKAFQRMLPLTGSLLGSLMDECRSIESDKIFAVRDLFEERKKIRELVRPLLAPEPSEEALGRMAIWLLNCLEQSALIDMLPSTSLTLDGELERVAEGDDSLYQIRDQAERFVKHIVDPNPGAPWPGNLEVWNIALLYVAIDLQMNLDGKREHTTLVAVGPFKDPSAADLLDGANRVDLLGAGFQGFDGFMSRDARLHDFAQGLLCAEAAAHACGVAGKAPAFPPPLEAVPPGIAAEIAQGRDLVAKRLEGLINDALPNMAVRTLAGALARQLIRKALRGMLRGLPVADVQEPVPIPLYLVTADPKLELDEKNWSASADEKAQDIGPEWGGYVLLAAVEYNFATGTWSGRNLDDAKKRLVIDRDGTLFDKTWCTVELPTAAQLSEWRNYPVACLKIRIPDSAEGKRVPSSGWKVVSLMPRSLEETLLPHA
jgi:predicted acylesterase/phospholipase RssA